MADNDNPGLSDKIKARKKPELKKWLRNHGIKVTDPQKGTRSKSGNCETSGNSDRATCPIISRSPKWYEVFRVPVYELYIILSLFYICSYIFLYF